MKKQRIDVMTLLMVTLVAVLIWYWATGETRESRKLGLDVILQVSEPDLWSINQPEGKVSVTATGSQRALRRAEALAPVVLDIDTEGGSRTIDLRAPLQDHPRVEATGVTIAEAPSLMVELDRLERSMAVVRPVLPGVRTLEDIEVDPPQVEVAIPERIRRRFPDALVVEPRVDRQQIEQLQRGVPQMLKPVKLHLPDANPDDGVRIEPDTATVSFTIGLQERVVRLESVRVQVLSSPEEYEITLDPLQLRDVEVTAPKTLADAIEAGEAVVVAVLHLKSTEKDRAITSKPVTSFMAITADGRGVPVDATIDGSSDRPMIELTIERVAP
jgi:hypothetical protein